MNANSPLPLHRQVSLYLREAILKGLIPPGVRLPSTRALARQWRLSRNTVLTAYDDLTAEGLVASRVGSGTRVCGRGPVPMLPDPQVLVRQAQYPRKTMPLSDPDGNPLYLHD